MRQTTNKLLARLHAAHPGDYPVEPAQLPSDGEVIHLHGKHVLVVDESAARPTVSLNELTNVGGRAQIALWVVNEDAVLDEISATSLAMRSACCRR